MQKMLKLTLFEFILIFLHISKSPLYVYKLKLIFYFYSAYNFMYDCMELIYKFLFHLELSK